MCSESKLLNSEYWNMKHFNVFKWNKVDVILFFLCFYTTDIFVSFNFHLIWKIIHLSAVLTVMSKSEYLGSDLVFV